jgi:hypothetical protein
MGTLAHLPNEGDEYIKHLHQQSSLSAYSNGDATATHRWAHPDHRISHGGSGGAQVGDESRPASQGVGSTTSGQSRPATSQGMSNHSTTPSAVASSQGRPGSTGTDVAPTPAMRHGFAEAYSSEEYLTMLEQVSFHYDFSYNQVFYMYFTYDRHESAATPTNTDVNVIEDWRPRERLSMFST